MFGIFTFSAEATGYKWQVKQIIDVRESRCLEFRRFVISFNKLVSIYRDWFLWIGMRPRGWLASRMLLMPCCCVVLSQLSQSLSHHTLRLNDSMLSDMTWDCPYSHLIHFMMFLNNFWARSWNCEKRVLASSCPSVRLSAPTGRIFTKLDIKAFFEKKNCPYKNHFNSSTNECKYNYI